MANLGVVDAWRIHFDTKQIFTGPLPRKNRLDYILMSESFSNQFYGDSRNFLPQHAGEHLAHSVSFRSGSQLHGRGYWKLPRYLLEYPTVVSAIETEAELVRDALRLASNPGKVWETWRTTIKKQLQAVQKKLRLQDSHAVDEARIHLDRAAARYRDSSSVVHQELYADAIRYYKEAVQRTSQ